MRQSCCAVPKVCGFELCDARQGLSPQLQGIASDRGLAGPLGMRHPLVEGFDEFSQVRDPFNVIGRVDHVTAAITVR
jgi:hypothetical protein